MKLFIICFFLLLSNIVVSQNKIDKDKIVGTWIHSETKWVSANYTFKDESEQTYTLSNSLITRSTVAGKLYENWFTYKIVSDELITTNSIGGKNYSTILELTDTKLVTRFIDKEGGDEVIITTWVKKK